jgi:hypothetical protein
MLLSHSSSLFHSLVFPVHCSFRLHGCFHSPLTLVTLLQERTASNDNPIGVFQGYLDEAEALRETDMLDEAESVLGELIEFATQTGFNYFADVAWKRMENVQKQRELGSLDGIVGSMEQWSL